MKARAFNYHDLEKARGGRAKTPGGSGGAQAARNTGPVIRIAIAKRREKLVMARLLAEATAGIKRLVRFTYIVKSTGLGGAITWKVTEPMTASLFGEYARLMGPAADSSLVKERGQRDQFTVGVSTTYRFNFSM